MGANPNEDRPYEGVGDERTRRTVEGRDAIDSHERPDLRPTESFNSLVKGIVDGEDFTLTQVQDPNLVMDAMMRRARKVDTLSSPIEQHTLEVMIALRDQKSRMTREWDKELTTYREKDAKLRAEANPSVTADVPVLPADEALLLATLEQFNAAAPFLPDNPSASKEPSKILPTADGKDWTAQMQEIDTAIAEMESRSGLSAAELELLHTWNDKDFMETGISTRKWLEMANFDPDKFSAEFVEKKRIQKAAGARAEADNISISQALEGIATSVERVYQGVRSSTQLRENMSQMEARAFENVPIRSLQREVTRLGRRLKHGLDISMNKASDTQRAIALGGAVVLLGAVLMSDNAFAKAIRKFSLGGVAGIAGLMALDVGSGAFFNGKRLSEKAAEALRLVGDGVQDNLFDVFKNNAEGNTPDEKRKHIESIAVFSGMAGDQPFDRLFEKYKAAKGAGKKELFLSGVDEGLIGKSKKKTPVIAFEAMDLIYKRYGNTLDNWDALYPHGPALASFGFLQLVTDLVTHDSAYKPDTQTIRGLLMKAAAVGRGAVEAAGKAAETVSEVTSSYLGDKAEIQKYVRELFPEDKYGSGIGIEKDSKDEKVLVLPGGVRASFRIDTREKEQDKSPSDEVNGFSLLNPYKEGVDQWVPFKIGVNDRDSMEKFCKELILDTAVYKMPQIDRDPQNADLMKHFKEDYGDKLAWHKTEKKWHIPAFTLQEKEYRLGANKLNFPRSRTNLYLHLGGKLDKGAFSVQFYRNRKYWSKEQKPTASFTQTIETIERENFKSWIVQSYHFPFTYDDIEISNWEELKNGSALTIEGDVMGGTSRSVHFSGKFGEAAENEVPVLDSEALFDAADSPLVFTFEFEPGANKEQQLNAMLQDVTRIRFDNLISLADSMNESWFKNIFPLNLRVWEYFSDTVKGGSVNEEEWKRALANRRDILISQIREGMTHGEIAHLNDVLIELAQFEEKVQMEIALGREIDAHTFDEIGLELETLGYPEGFTDEFGYFKNRMETFYRFDAESLQEISNLYQSLALKEGADGRTIMEILKNGSTAEQDSAIRYLRYYTERITAHFNKGHKGGLLDKVTAGDVKTLRLAIESGQDRTNPQVDADKWPTVDEYINPSAAQETINEFADMVMSLHRMWMQHTDLVTAPALKRIKWTPFGFRHTQWTAKDMAPFTGQWPDMVIPVDPNDLSKGVMFNPDPKINIDSPALRRVFDFENYHIVWRVLGTVGLYPQGLAEKLAFPNPTRSVGDFKFESATFLETFLLTNSADPTKIDTPSELMTLFTQFNAGMENIFRHHINGNLLGQDLTTILSPQYGK